MLKYFKETIELEKREVEDHRSLIEEVRRINGKIRNKNLQSRTSKELDKPVRYWTGTEVTSLQGKIKRFNALTIVLGTQGCKWAIQDPGGGCIFCGYLYDNPLEVGNLIENIRYVKENLGKKEREKTELIKLYTSGSFLDTREVPLNTQKEILNEALTDFPNAEVFQIEARPEDLLKSEVYEVLLPLKQEVSVYFNIGLESADDKILSLINKGLTFKTYKSAVKKAKREGFRIKTYLLLKPPFLTEKEAIYDVINSGKKVINLESDIISVNPLTVQKGTFVEYLWKQDLYRPPWPQSIVYVLNELLELKTDQQVIKSEPVALGRERGPHGTRRYTKKLKTVLEKLNATQSSLSLPEETLLPWKAYRKKEVQDLAFSSIL